MKKKENSFSKRRGAQKNLRIFWVLVQSHPDPPKLLTLIFGILFWAAGTTGYLLLSFPDILITSLLIASTVILLSGSVLKKI